MFAPKNIRHTLIKLDKEVDIEAYTPTLVVVVKGLARVTIKGFNLDLGPCNMLYIPRSKNARIKPLDSETLLYLTESFDKGDKFEIVYRGGAVKTPCGEKIVCLNIDEKGLRIHLKARAYIALGQAVAFERGSWRELRDGELVTPDTCVKAVNGKASIILLTGIA